MCRYNDIIIDVGCDHGYISINLIKNQKCRKCYAIDIKDLPLNNAKQNIIRNKLEDYIECIKSDGFAFLNKNTKDTAAVIAGMGGSTIASIIKNDLDLIKNMNYILIQPNSYAKDIRRYLNSINMYIKAEDVIFSEGVYYEYILIFPKQQEILSKEYQNFLLEFEYEIPICVINNSDGRYNGFIQWRISRYEKALLEMQNSECTSIEIVKFHKKISMLRGYLK